MDIHAYLGIAAGLLEVASWPIYIASILRGETKPDRVTWWILALVSGTILATYYASGARDTIWLPLAFTLFFLIDALLSVKYGEGPLTLHFLDRVCLAGAFLGLLIWWLTDSPVLGLYMNVGVDFIGLVPTIFKAYKKPWTENRLAWGMGTIACFLNLFAIAHWSLEIALYPVYLFLSNAVILYFIRLPRAKES